MKFDRLKLTLIINIIHVILAVSSLIIEIVKIHTNPNSLYINVWGIFRYFTIDGNILSLIFTIIMMTQQIKAIKLDKIDLIFSNFLYKISLMSATTDLVIFIVVVLIFLPMSDHNWVMGLIGSYNASSFHITIPILLTFRFIFLDVKEKDLRLYEKFLGGVPMCIYGVIMYILCICKVFKSFNKEEGDGKIPYPFFDVYHSSWYFCLFCAIFIFAFGFGIGFLLDFLNKKCGKLILPYNLSSKDEIGETATLDEDKEDNENKDRILEQV